MKLTKEDLREIGEFDAKYRRDWLKRFGYDTGLSRPWKCRRTFRHNFLKPIKGGEVAIVTVATRYTRKDKWECKAICVARTDRDEFACRDLEYHGLGGWVVIWPDSKPCPSGYYQTPLDTLAAGWCGHAYKWREALVSPWSQTINPHALEGTKYQHSGYEYIGTRPLLDHLKLYRQNKGDEFLAKAGLDSLLCPGGIKRLQKSREFFAFVRQHLDEIAKNGYSFPVIQYAQVHKKTLAEALQHFENLHSWNYYRLPKSVTKYVDAITAHQIKTKISQFEYRNYLEYAESAGWNMDDPHVYLPPKRRWKARLEHAEAEANKAKEARRRMAEKDIDKTILKVATAFGKLAEFTRGKYSLVIPTSCAELRAEGKAMSNCIGSMGYDRKTAEGTTILLFVRKGGKVYSDIEIDRKTQRIRQHYAIKNSRPDTWARSFADLAVKRYRRIEKKLRREA